MTTGLIRESEPERLPASRDGELGSSGSPRRLAIFPIGSRRSSAEHPLALWRRFGRDLLRGAAVVVMLHLFVLQISVVRGNSMEPSLMDGDRLVVDRVTYSFADVDRFDVVVMRNPVNQSVDYVKRIVGLPGDVVELRRGRVHINGTMVQESFAHISDQDSTASLVVPPGSFFVLGDNRPISCDSREFGLVRSDLLKGKVRFRFWPLDRLGAL